MMRSGRHYGYAAGGIALLAGLWLLLAALPGSALPAPAEVLQTLLREWHSGTLVHHIGITLQRVAVSFALAMLLGVSLGVLMGLSDALNLLLEPVLQLLLNTPALVVIILLYISLGLTEWAAISAVVLNKLPNVMISLRQGARSLDRQYFAVAQIYRFSATQTLREVILPQLSPYLLVAVRTGLSLIWKIVLVVELLGRSDGVGFQLHLAFQLFDVSLLLAYSLVFVAIVQLIEWFVLQPWERRQNRWRNSAGQHHGRCELGAA